MFAQSDLLNWGVWFPRQTPLMDLRPWYTRTTLALTRLMSRNESRGIRGGSAFLRPRVGSSQ